LARAFCQSGVFKKPQKIEQPTIRDDGLFGSDSEADIQNCASDEIVIAGGGECMDPSTHFIHYSAPTSDGLGWAVNCYGLSGYPDEPAKAYAICLKKQ
jgi:hypothetical protein